MGQWTDADRVVGDPLVVAAARAGDARAMRCIAHRTWARRGIVYQPPDTAVTLEAQVLETARWYAEAARHGDPTARAELDSYLEAEHSAQHLARVPADTPWRRARAARDCRPGAEQGYASCMLRWAERLRALGPDHDDEAGQWRERARHGQPDLPAPAGQPPGLSVDPATIALTAVVTAAVVPFVQAMVTKAGEDSYDGLRRWLGDRFRRALPPRHRPDQRDQLLVIGPSPGRPEDAVVQVWTDLPDEAITALSQLLYDLRAAQVARPEGGKAWYWNNVSRRWELLELPPTKK
jgi:hypothetical protein